MPRHALLLLLPLLALTPILHRLPAEDDSPPKPGLNATIDQLLDKHQRRAFVEQLAKREYGGKTHAWEQYVAWGRSLATQGQVKDPPVEPSPSTSLAETYRCVHCHNLVREDEKLAVQDPETREKLIRSVKPGVEPEKPDAALRLTPATTLWGAVNRERFYNGHYEEYHRLKLEAGAAMNPDSLADAVQICCNYCSAGRFPEPWELDSLVAFLWTLELRMKDLNLPEKEAQALLEQLQSDEDETVKQARKSLRQHYLARAGADCHDEPVQTKEAVDTYADGTRYSGDAARGRLLYRSACAGCHGTDVHPKADAELVAGDKLFHRYVWKGTEREGVYMPRFTQQRLSRQQAADIRVYLHSLPEAR